MMTALSPLDGRYASQMEGLRACFSEAALHRARILVEIRYFIALSQEAKIRELPPLSRKQEARLLAIVDAFTEREAETVRELERTTNHDMKACEYYLKKKMGKLGFAKHQEFIHFALTSEDVNNLAYGLLIHRALKEVVVPSLGALLGDLKKIASSAKSVPMLSLTHGQPATPTTVGKEFQVFASRLDRQMAQLKTFRMQGKLGGAVGNFSAHYAAYPDVNWEAFRDRFVKGLGLTPLAHTTQINPHDDMAELSHILHRIDVILLDCSRDVWQYIARGIFRQKVIAGEVGSSTMPHKVNPIDFENAEGNLGLANALFDHFASKLPISRLQRDLSDSTVQRSIGTALGYHHLAVRSLRKGLGKLQLDREAVKRELRAHPEVAAEAVQTVLRKHGVQGAYEKLKQLTRGEKMTREAMVAFIRGLPLPGPEKERLVKMVP